jgi:hypothetical protein
MKERWSFALTILSVTLLSGAAVLHAIDNPVAGLFRGRSDIGGTTLIGQGRTELGTLNARGAAVFNLRNDSGQAITSLLVTIDAGAPASPARYSCSALTQLLRSCRTEMTGTLIHLVFSGEPAIERDAEFRLGFAAATDGTSWPPSRPVAVTVNGQLPSAGSR